MKKKSDWAFTSTCCINLSKVTIVERTNEIVTFYFGSDHKFEMKFTCLDHAIVSFENLKASLDPDLLD